MNQHPIAGLEPFVLHQADVDHALRAKDVGSRKLPRLRQKFYDLSGDSQTHGLLSTRSIAVGLVFDGFENQFLSRGEIEIRTSAAGTDNDDFVGLNDNATVKAGRRYRNHDELHRGVLCFCSFSRMREGLLERSFDDAVECADSYAHSRYRATGGASLYGLDGSIAHTKFMH